MSRSQISNIIIAYIRLNLVVICLVQSGITGRLYCPVFIPCEPVFHIFRYLYFLRLFITICHFLKKFFCFDFYLCFSLTIEEFSFLINRNSTFIPSIISHSDIHFIYSSCYIFIIHHHTTFVMMTLYNQNNYRPSSIQSQ